MTAVEITLLHTNDMHDRRTVFPWLEARPRDGCTLLVDAGDAIRGSNTVFHMHEPMLDLMSRAGYDAMTMGNREFHYLRGVFRRRFEQVRFPFVCANVHDLRGKINHLWQPTLVKTIAGVRIGVVGLTPVQYLDGSPWQPLFGFRFTRALDVLPGLVRELSAQVDVVILLSHQGFKADRAIAEKIPGLHVIVGGHSHHLLEQPVVVNGVRIVQTGCYGRYVGRMRLRVGRDGSVETPDYELVPMPDAEPLPAGTRCAEAS